MGQTNQQDDFIGRIKRLEREVAALRRGITLNGAVLSQGALEVRTDDGQVIVRLGRFEQDGQTVHGIAVYRHDGSLQAWLWDTTAEDGGGSLRDASGNVLFADDTSGNGLARPQVPLTFTSATSTAPTDTTTSGSFTDLQYAKYRPQHPRLAVTVLARSSDGSTTGELQVLVGGVALAAAQTVTAGMFGSLTFGPATLPGAYSHLTPVDVVVQGRRTAGAGTIGARVLAAYGEQS